MSDGFPARNRMRRTRYRPAHTPVPSCFPRMHPTRGETHREPKGSGAGRRRSLGWGDRGCPGDRIELPTRGFSLRFGALGQRLIGLHFGKSRSANQRLSSDSKKPFHPIFCCQMPPRKGPRYQIRGGALCDRATSRLPRIRRPEAGRQTSSAQGESGHINAVLARHDLRANRRRTGAVDERAAERNIRHDVARQLRQLYVARKSRAKPRTPCKGRAGRTCRDRRRVVRD